MASRAATGERVQNERVGLCRQLKDARSKRTGFGVSKAELPEILYHRK